MCYLQIKTAYSFIPNLHTFYFILVSGYTVQNSVGKVVMGDILVWFLTSEGELQALHFSPTPAVTKFLPFQLTESFVFFLITCGHWILLTALSHVLI